MTHARGLYPLSKSPVTCIYLYPNPVLKSERKKASEKKERKQREMDSSPNKKEEAIVIVGGGISGLAAALALHR